jgi:hypothetical protein
LPIGLALVVCTVTARSARADVKQACVQASTDGQALRDGEKLREARERFVACARDECPSIVRKYCAEWLTDIERRIPTVIFRAQSKAGEDLVGGRLTIDGTLQSTGFGAAIPLDPGEHVVHAERTIGLGPPVDEHVMVIEGEKGRIVTLNFPAPPAPHPAVAVTPVTEEASPSRGRRIGAATWVAGGVALAGFASFGVFAVVAQGDLSHLRQTCAPYCGASDLSSVKTEALVADISLGVGVAGLAALTYTLLTHHEPPPAVSMVRVLPRSGGASVSLGATF